MVQPQHPLGTKAKVLLSSVFGPYAQDDQYGSRLANPMELFHNQVTRVQGPFSIRSFYRSWGLLLIQANLRAHCAVLDFPTEARFVEELQNHQYDIVGISAIMPNLLKVRRMCKLIRKYQPTATIVIGGHVANFADINQILDADYIVRGDGVAWMRNFVGDDITRPIVHPMMRTDVRPRVMGMSLVGHPSLDNATLIPGVGCPKGCNFCSTSAMFGGKGHFVEFYRTGTELFEVMCQLESALQVHGFFVMDENFLFNRPRAIELLCLMERHNKSWYLEVFSSADVLQKYSYDQLVRLGINWVWLGLEGKNAQYKKLSGVDTVALVKELQSYGICVLGSSIIGLDEHTPDNIEAAIEHAVSHCADLHQFMLYTPIPGTPLYTEYEQAGKLIAGLLPGDIHGQRTFNFRHSHIPPGAEEELLLRAFRRDFDLNGPSVLRIIRTILRGWKRNKHHPAQRVRTRFEREAKEFAASYIRALWAMAHYYRPRDMERWRVVGDVLLEAETEFAGTFDASKAELDGFRLCQILELEEKRLERGRTYEPPTFYGANK